MNIAEQNRRRKLVDAIMASCQETSLVERANYRAELESLSTPELADEYDLWLALTEPVDITD